ncbi:Flagellar hook-length control protein fliK [Streptomyces murinus]
MVSPSRATARATKNSPKSLDQTPRPHSLGPRSPTARSPDRPATPATGSPPGRPSLSTAVSPSDEPATAPPDPRAATAASGSTPRRPPPS